MKKTFKVLGIIGLMLVIGFSFTACGDDDGGGGGAEPDVELAGTTWKLEFKGAVGAKEQPAQITWTLTFITASEFKEEENSKIIADGSTYSSSTSTGTYTISGNSGTMTFINPDAGNVFRVWQFEVNGDKLKATVKNNDGTQYNRGTFTKQ